MLRASTLVAAVIGSPVRHSRSPLLANAAFRASGLDWAFLAFEVAEGDGAAAVEAARVLGIRGLMVTMPHKAAVIPALDELTPAARDLGAVNSIARVDDRLIGDNTDGAGLVASLRAEDADPAGRHCVVLGAGGAARSIIRALGDAGASRVAVLNRTRGRAEAAAPLAGTAGVVGGPDEIAAADIVINATSVGMGADPDDPAALPLDPRLLRSGQIVLDAVYQPLETGLLRAASRAGARPIDGLGMLVHQAAISIAAWTGESPDVEAMSSAARA